MAGARFLWLRARPPIFSETADLLTGRIPNCGDIPTAWRRDMLDWLKRVFAKKQTIGDAIGAYGALLEKYPSAIIDVSMLPTSKPKLKGLLKALYADTTDAEFANHIEVAFMSLSKFQYGVGSIPIDCTLGAGTSRADMAADSEKLEKWLPWAKLSSAEAEILLAEWDRFREGKTT
jgi:hypothetical protein